jgi:hypothetical protein
VQIRGKPGGSQGKARGVSRGGTEYQQEEARSEPGTAEGARVRSVAPWMGQEEPDVMPRKARGRADGVQGWSRERGGGCQVRKQGRQGEDMG